MKILLKTSLLMTLIASNGYAAAIVNILPSSTNPIAVSPAGSTYLNYTIQNPTAAVLSQITIEPGYGGVNKNLGLLVTNNQCSNMTLKTGGSCSFSIEIKAQNIPAVVTLTPRVCIYRGAVCSIPVVSQRVKVIVSNRISNTTFPTPYAGTFYPLYNSGAGQWLPPDQAPIPPFNEVSAIFAAFAHAYPQGAGAVFDFEVGQPDEKNRLRLLSQTARSANPNIKILMSLGWGKNDWSYINNDYVNRANIFVPSVIRFIRENHLDGVDIDDESIGEEGPDSSGFISQTNFNGVIANLRNALNVASLQDGKTYYLTITPAGNNQAGGIADTQVDAQNAASFNLINIQSYYNGSDTFAEDFYAGLIAIGYPKQQIANGIDTQASCTPDYPPYEGLAGLFNWNMTADSVCSDYANTGIIANLVGY